MYPINTTSLSPVTYSVNSHQPFKFMVNTTRELFNLLLRLEIIEETGKVTKPLSPPPLSLPSSMRLNHILHQPLEIYSNSNVNTEIRPNTLLTTSTFQFLLSPFYHDNPCLIGSSVFYVLGIEYFEQVFDKLNIKLSENIKEVISQLFNHKDFDVRIDLRKKKDRYKKCQSILNEKIQQSMKPDEVKNEWAINQSAYLKSGHAHTNNLFILRIGDPLGVHFDLSFYDQDLERPYMYTLDDLVIFFGTGIVETSTGDILQPLLDKLFQIIRTDDYPLNNLMWSRYISYSSLGYKLPDPHLCEALLDSVIAKKPAEKKSDIYLLDLLKHTALNHLRRYPDVLIHLAFHAGYLVSKKIQPEVFKRLWIEVLKQCPQFVDKGYIPLVLKGFCQDLFEPQAFYHFLFLNHDLTAKKIVTDFCYQTLLDYCLNPHPLLTVENYYPQKVSILNKLFELIIASPSWLPLWKAFKESLYRLNYSQDQIANYQLFLPYIPLSLKSLLSQCPDVLPEQKFVTSFVEEMQTTYSLPLSLSKITTSKSVGRPSVFLMTGIETDFQSHFDLHANRCKTLSSLIETLKFAQIMSQHLSSHNNFAELLVQGLSKYPETFPKNDYDIDFSKISSAAKRLELLHMMNCFKVPYKRFDFTHTLQGLSVTAENDELVRKQIPCFEKVILCKEALSQWLNALAHQNIMHCAIQWVFDIYWHLAKFEFMNAIPTVKPFIYFVLKNENFPYLHIVEELRSKFCLCSVDDDKYFFSIHLKRRSDLILLIEHAIRLNNIAYWNEIFADRGPITCFLVNPHSLSPTIRFKFFNLALTLPCPKDMTDAEHIDHIKTLRDSIDPLSQEIKYAYLNWLLSIPKLRFLIEAIKYLQTIADTVKKGASILPVLAKCLLNQYVGLKPSLQAYTKPLFLLPFSIKDKLFLAASFGFEDLLAEYSKTFQALKFKEKYTIALQACIPDLNVLNYFHDFVNVRSLHPEMDNELHSKLFTKWLMAVFKTHAASPLHKDELIKFVSCAIYGFSQLDISEADVELSCLNSTLALIADLFTFNIPNEDIAFSLDTLVLNIGYNSLRINLYKGNDWIPYLPQNIDDHTENKPIKISLTPLKSEIVFSNIRMGTFTIKIIKQLLLIPNLSLEQSIFISSYAHSCITTLSPTASLFPMQYAEGISTFIRYESKPLNPLLTSYHASNVVSIIHHIQSTRTKKVNEFAIILLKFIPLLHESIENFKNNYKAIISINTIESCIWAFRLFHDNILRFIKDPQLFENFWEEFFKTLKNHIFKKLDSETSVFSCISKILCEDYLNIHIQLTRTHKHITAMLRKYILFGINEPGLSETDQIDLYNIFYVCCAEGFYKDHLSEAFENIKIWQKKIPLDEQASVLGICSYDTLLGILEKQKK